ncbi:hypothetical protein HPB48_006174 [Haemaphysalis longicornis]|uniref:Tick transposon n=1 Tax=Haemaphysalis longicornis TaxID=44386 RepID=A0A9J6GZC2_HAELO|nr:hypothetical protein HPB48_006174 [Haemaphysalis longicornis]
MLRLLRVPPLPKNTNPEHHPERRLARARSLASKYAADNTAYYTDAAEDRARPNYYTAVAIAASDGTIRTAGSFEATDSHHAEELAIAIAATDPRCRTILSDSRTAILRFANNTTSTRTARFLHRMGQTRQHPIFISWYPAHVGPLDPEGRIHNRNEEADRAARGLTCRETHTSQHSERNRNSQLRAEEIKPAPLETYGDILRWYRHNRQRLLAPHPQLTRREGVLYRQLQTDSILTPVLARYICPTLYNTDRCIICKTAAATTAHILNDCTRLQTQSEAQELPPKAREAITSSDYNTQLQAVRQVEEALTRQREGYAVAQAITGSTRPGSEPTPTA